MNNVIGNEKQLAWKHCDFFVEFLAETQRKQVKAKSCSYELPLN